MTRRFAVCVTAGHEDIPAAGTALTDEPDTNRYAYCEACLTTLGDAYEPLRWETPARGPWKLVRDRIPEIIRAKGETPNVRRAHPDEMPALIAAKLVEEATECAEATTAAHQLEELADLLEVLDVAARSLGTDLDTVAAVAAAKREARGGFTEGWVWSPS